MAEFSIDRSKSIIESREFTSPPIQVVKIVRLSQQPVI